jgi:hypothetical protein
VNVTEGKEFIMEGGILEVGGGILLSFMFVNESGVLNISHVSIEFGNVLGSIIFVEGGIVTLDYLQMNNQHPTYWVAGSLVYVDYYYSVAVHLLNCIITNCTYVFGLDGFYYFESSPIVCVVPQARVYIVTLNMSSCFFENNNFNLNSDERMGCTCLFSSYHSDSGLFVFFFCFLLIFYFFFLVLFFFSISFLDFFFLFSFFYYWLLLFKSHLLWWCWRYC